MSSLKDIKNEQRRIKASLNQMEDPPNSKKRKPDLSLCFYCKEDPGKNFMLLYKKNQELKGKICRHCFEEFKEIRKLNV